MSSDSPKEAHEIQRFMEQLSNEMASEYVRIRTHARKDPGTAGDDSEETWKSLFESWLPPNLPIVTKGRIIGADGALSPQVDLLVLDPSYPKKMLNKKKYLAGGVLAAFECKLTLRKDHLAKAAKTGRIIQQIAEGVYRKKTLRTELNSPIMYGILAHSSTWTAKTAASHIDRLLSNHLFLEDLPRRSIDVLCVSDLACWSSFRLVLPPLSFVNPEIRDLLALRYPPDGMVVTQYSRWESVETKVSPNPLYVLIGALLKRISWEIPEARKLAAYWSVTRVQGGGVADPIVSRSWPMSVLAEEIHAHIQRGGLTSGDPWSEWGSGYG